MPKLESSESLESLIPGEKMLDNYTKRETKPTRIWFVITYLNFFMLVTTLALIGASFHTLQGFNISTTNTPRQSYKPSPVHDHSGHSQHQLATSNEWLTCGNTSAEALAHGCVFDLMLSTWLHPECYSAEHTETALDKGNFSFFLDEQLTIPFDYERAKIGDWPQKYIWTTPEYHAIHCSYMWERTIKAWTSGGKIDTQCWNLGHSTHCAKLVLEKNSPSEYEYARLKRGLSDCGRPAVQV